MIRGYAAVVDAEADRSAADRVHLDPADRPQRARRRAGPAARPARDRGLPLGRGGGELHPQGAGAHPVRPGDAAGPDPGRRERLHPDDDRAQHARTSQDHQRLSRDAGHHTFGGSGRGMGRAAQCAHGAFGHNRPAGGEARRPPGGPGPCPRLKGPRRADPAPVDQFPAVPCWPPPCSAAPLLAGSLLAPPGAAATTDPGSHGCSPRSTTPAPTTGCAPLRAKPDLMPHARTHSAAMAAPATAVPHQRRSASVCCWSMIAENIGVRRDASAACTGPSCTQPPHRANILNPRLRQVGVGIVSRNGQLWVTEIFTKPS